MTTGTPPTDAASESPYYGGPLGAGIDWADPNSRLAPLYLSTAGVVGAGILGLYFIVLTAAPLWHTDFWAHLAYGEWVSAHRALPDREPLSPFTDKQSRLFAPLWLTQVGYHELFRAGAAVAGGDEQRRFEGGVEVIRLAHALAAVATLALFGLAYRRVGGSPGWAVTGVVFVLLLLLTPLSVQRPQLFALVCFATLLCGLSGPVPTRRAVIWIPLLLTLWMNVHGSVLVGLGMLGVVLAGRVVEVCREGGAAAALRDTAARRLAVALAIAVAGSAVVNPYGPAVFAELARFGSNPNLKTVAEWQPLDFSQPRGGHWGYLATMLVVVTTQVMSPRAFTPTQLLLILSFGVWPLFQQRALIWWVPLVPWLAIPHWVARLEAGGPPPARVPSFRKTALAALVVAVAAIASPPARWVKARQPRPVTAALHPGTPYDVAAALTGGTPAAPARVAELARVVREEHGGRFTGRVFASDVLGDYLVHALPSDTTPVMLFNHAPAFAPGYWTECLGVLAASPGWWEFLDRHRAGVVVLEADHQSELCAGLRGHPGWRVVVDEAGAPARDDFTRLFVAVRKPAAGGPAR